MPTVFELIHRREGRVAKIVCRGELDLVTAPALTEAIDHCLQERPERLILDGTGITFLTSSGIESLLHAVETARARGVTLHLDLSPHARRILDMIGLWWLGVVDDGLALQDALRDAVRAYGRLPDPRRRHPSEGGGPGRFPPREAG